MFKKIFQRIRFRMMARQLRRPGGIMGSKVGLMMNKANAFLYDFTLGMMRPADQDTILEIGFGNGHFFDKVFAAAKGLEVKGLDFSETMFREAKRQNQEAIRQGRLDLHFGSSEKMPFPDNSIDKIYCINVIYFWDQPLPHLQEIFRVLKPGGRFYATVRTRESMLKMPFTQYGFNFYDAENWKALLAQTGLTFTGEYPVDEPIIEFDNKKVVVQSLCVVAEKQKH